MKGGTIRAAQDAPGSVCYGTYGGNATSADTFGDEGSAARFFYCAKATRRDRNEGCEHMERKPLHWSSGSQNPGSFQSEGTDKTSQNNHPTVNPTDLMAYLVRLAPLQAARFWTHSRAAVAPARQRYAEGSSSSASSARLPIWLSPRRASRTNLSASPPRQRKPRKSRRSSTSSTTPRG